MRDTRTCQKCRGRGFGAYLSDASGLDDHCPACSGTGRIEAECWECGNTIGVGRTRMVDGRAFCSDECIDDNASCCLDCHERGDRHASDCPVYLREQDDEIADARQAADWEAR